MPFAFLFGLYVPFHKFSLDHTIILNDLNRGMFSTIFLYMVDVKKSRIECDEFVMAEATQNAFGK
ncbi:hypothetical protein J3R82DRAFT_11982 [Butyriboletus roseoflavus]|nr:hypothetical protein J3R82DRAFT_11982 [Butyriboletus roseoflavus]